VLATQINLTPSRATELGKKKFSAKIFDAAMRGTITLHTYFIVISFYSDMMRMAGANL
jgi:hypothetical protein